MQSPGSFNPEADPAHTFKVEWAVRHPQYTDVGQLTRMVGTGPDRVEKYTYPTRKGDGRDVPWPLHDIALVKFAGREPEGYRVRPLLRDAGDLAPGREGVTLIGYGCDGAESSAWGTLRSLRTDAVQRLQKERDFKEIIVVSKEKGVCQGDSGGPILFSRNDEILVGGVLSRGLPVEGSHGGIYTDPFAYSDWLQGWFAAPPCLAYKTLQPVDLFVRPPVQIPQGVTLRALYMGGADPTRPTTLRGLAQVEVAEGPLAGTQGVVSTEKLQPLCQ